jgi:hypothetical protein
MSQQVEEAGTAQGVLTIPILVKDGFPRESGNKASRVSRPSEIPKSLWQGQLCDGDLGEADFGQNPAGFSRRAR